jgi:two-component system cell cycle response regulator DivK
MSKTILIVEDNPSNLKLASTVLEHAGYHVLSTESATNAIVMAQALLPHLILMDIQLPGMSGLEATRQLKSNAATSSIPIIALTAFAMKGDKERTLDAGCDGYIAKPFGYKDLLAKVMDTIGRAQKVTTP